MFELLDRKPAQSDAGTQTPHGTPAGGDIEFDNVWCATCLLMPGSGCSVLLCFTLRAPRAPALGPAHTFEAHGSVGLCICYP